MDQPPPPASPLPRRAVLAVAGTVATGAAATAAAAGPAAAAPFDGPLAGARMDHVAIRAFDFDATVRWYTEKLGFREEAPRFHGPAGEPPVDIAYLRLNDCVVEVIGGGGPSRPVPPPRSHRELFATAGWNHFCLRVDSMDAAVAELRRRGVEVYIGPTRNPDLGRVFAHVQDNNGYDIELVQYP